VPKRHDPRIAAALLVLAGSAHALGAGVFPAAFELASLDGTNGFVLSGVGAGDLSGSSVASAGDVNGDGYDDLIIGAYEADPGGRARAGETYVVFGGEFVGAGGTIELSDLLPASGGDGTSGFVVSGIDAGDRSGYSVAPAGDVNGDGLDDLIVGARTADPGGLGEAGECYIVFGAPGIGAGGSIDPSGLDGTDGFVLLGIDAGDQSGFSVSRAGDVNGDGLDDLIIGAPNADPSGALDAGESYVVFGDAGLGAGGSLQLATLDGANGFVLEGIDSNDYSGCSVSSAGDVNGDGLDDLIVGARRANPSSRLLAGESYVVFGAVGLGADGSVALEGLLPASGGDGTDGFVLKGISASDFSGFSVSAVGDVNADGVDDLIIGAPNADPDARSEAGESYVVFGGVGLGAGGSLELSALNGGNGFVVNGVAEKDFSGRSVAPAGDVDGDGLDDLIIGARSANPPGRLRAGESYVVFGGACVGAGGAVELAALRPEGGGDGTDGVVFLGIDAGDESGCSVASAGDVNGDGVDDLIIGALRASPGGRTDAGESYVVFGRSSRGACCLGVGVCVEGFEASCADIGGVFVGLGTECATADCPGCVGDINRDGATDVFDFADFADDFGCGTD
jgi:hypothetical protein